MTDNTIGKEEEDEQLLYEQLNHLWRRRDGRFLCHLCDTIILHNNITSHIFGYRHNKKQTTLDSLRKDNLTKVNLIKVGQTQTDNLQECEEKNSEEHCESMGAESLEAPPKTDIALSSKEIANMYYHDRAEYEYIVQTSDGFFTCTLCKAKLLDFITMEQHLVGHRHTRNLRKTSATNYPWCHIDEIPGGRREHIEVVSYKKYRCIPCKQTMEAKQLIPHMRCKTHRHNIGFKDRNEKKDFHHIWNEVFSAEGGRWSHISKLGNESFLCKPCDNTILSAAEVLLHVKTQSHQYKINEPEILDSNKILARQFDKIWETISEVKGVHKVHFKIDSESFLYCISCDTIVPATSAHINAHLSGKSHMSIAIQHLIAYPDLQLGAVQTDPGTIISKSTIKDQLDTDETETTEQINSDFSTDVCVANPDSDSEESESEDSTCSFTKAICQIAEDVVRSELPTNGLMDLDCTVCDVRIHSKDVYEKHMYSHDHIQNVERQVEQGHLVISQKCSKCDTLVVCADSNVNRHKCCILSEHYLRIESALKNLACNSCKHKRKFPEDIPNERPSEKENSPPNVTVQEDRCKCFLRIIITGHAIGTSMDQIYAKFRQYGTISYVAVNNEYAIVEFFESSAVEEVLDKQISLGRKRLYIHRLKELKEKESKTVTLENCVEKIFEKKGIFISKVYELMNEIDAVSDPLLNSNMCQLVERACKKYFPGCKAIPFGSRVSGLAFPHSDMDIFLDAGEMYNGNEHQDAQYQKLIAEYVENALKEERDCSNVIAVPNARTPIVKFTHVPSETRCDVAFKNGIGIENTSLLRYFMDLDPRVKPVIVFLKYWLHVHELSGCHNITNYALTWLVLFYLMQPSQLGLPSVKHLKNLYKIADQEERIIAGWNCGCMVDESYLKPITSIKSVPQLICGFYRFYQNFDYPKYVICPLLGVPIQRTLFVQNRLPDCLDEYSCHISSEKNPEKIRIQGGIVLQDPFDLSHNITKGTTYVVLRKFRDLCRLSAELCEKLVCQGPE